MEDTAGNTVIRIIPAEIMEQYITSMEYCGLELTSVEEIQPHEYN